MKEWLENAVFYEIYPASFYDANGDGIGDLQGIIKKLDYVQSLGCNGIWLNACFDSAFKDGGYDVRDYYRIAPRYGTNDDMQSLCEQAHKRGIRVLLDLVPGHTSEEHPWFRESAKSEHNECSDRYIWTDSAFCGAFGRPFIAGESPRNGAYVLNCFKCQPALNYGYLKRRAPWQLPPDHPACLKNREAMKDIMRFWLKLGCDGFRVDMADSLVKDDDEQKSATQEVWRDILSGVRNDFAEAVFVSEWCAPEQALSAGFDMDFYLNNNNGYTRLMRDYTLSADYREIAGDKSYFKQQDGAGIGPFLADYLPKYEASRGKGHFCFVTGNHNTPRIAGNLSIRELELCYAFLFTMPGVPFLYYGDEIGMKYLPCASREGGYHRTGSRTPMQWNGDWNKGFSPVPLDCVYLPVDPAADAPTVDAQEGREDSLLTLVRRLIALRKRESGLHASSPFQPVQQGKRLFAYKRGDLLLAINPGSEAETLNFPAGKIVFSLGNICKEGDKTVIEGGSFAIFRKAE